MIISFTGHRSQKIGGFKIPNPSYNWVCQETEHILRDLKPEKAISGMALGYDQYAAWICFKLNIPVIAAIPFIGQEKMWNIETQAKYHRLLDKCSEKIIVSDGEYASWKMQARNQWMVDHGDLVLACFDGSNGGTKNCIDYATSLNKKIIKIDPNGFIKNAGDKSSY